MTQSMTAYVRKCLRSQFESGQNEVVIDDVLNMAVFWQKDKLDTLFFEIDPSTGEEVEKHPGKLWEDAYIDLSIGTLSSIEDEFGRLKETYFEFYDDDAREFFFERIRKERAELSNMCVPDFFIPYHLELPHHELGKVKGLRVINDPDEEDDVWDFDIYTRREQEDDDELRDLTKEARKVLPVALYSAHRINIQAKRGEPIFVLDERNNILDGAEEIKVVEEDHDPLEPIRKARETRAHYLPDGEFEISLRHETPKIMRVFFESTGDNPTIIDFYCKVNAKGFIAAGSLVYGCIRRENSTVLFQVDRTGFMRMNQENVLPDFWWTNIFGCKMKVDKKCAVWTKNFKKSSGYTLSRLEPDA